MTVIAMTREMGSRGKEVALGVADALGLEIVHHELVESHVSRRLGISTTAVHRFLEGNPTLMERFRVDARSLLLYTAEELFDLAGQGNILIRGWGATYLLREVPHVLCLRVCAPMPFRVRTMMARLGIEDRSIAEREIRGNDAAHDRVMRQHFGVEWRDPLLYDMVLNMGGIPVDTAVALVREVVAAPAFAETPHSRTALARARLEARLRAALASEPGISEYSDGLAIEVSDDAETVTLRGLVRDQAMRRDVERIAGAVPGVRRVNAECVLASELPLRS